MTKESVLENRLVQGAKSLDCLVRKLSFIGRRGAPDRLVITPKGAVFWVEMKTDRGRLSAVQKRELTNLKLYKQRVYVLFSAEQIESFLEMFKCYLN